MADDDRELIARFRSGDRAAFDALYARYAGRALAFALRITGSRADAEDLVQEAFLAAYRGSRGFHGRSAFLTWLLGIVVRRWRDTVRSTRTRADFERQNPREQCHSPVRDASRDAIDVMAVEAALDALPEALREAFLLVAGQGLTHREAAQAAGCPVGTMKWRVAEAARRLRTMITDLDREEDEHVQPVQI